MHRGFQTYAGVIGLLFSEEEEETGERWAYWNRKRGEMEDRKVRKTRSE